MKEPLFDNSANSEQKQYSPFSHINPNQEVRKWQQNRYELTEQQNGSQIEQAIFRHLKLSYKVNEIRINNQDELLHTVFIETEVEEHKEKCHYLTHGFGGSSLMYFPIIQALLKTGSVVLFELRGMGLSHKLPKYTCRTQQIQRFFSEPIGLMLNFYKHEVINFIGHSFGAYCILSYILLHSGLCDKKSSEQENDLIVNNINQVILLSPAGLTTKNDDYKSKIDSVSSFFHFIANHISWKFQLTYKSLFRTVFKCLKNRLLTNALHKSKFTQIEKQLVKELLFAMIDSPDGSENLFFNLFQPRVLPKYPLQPIFKEYPGTKLKLKIIYGGERDWVDKTGAQMIKQRFQKNISYKVIQECAHNFPFEPQVLIKIVVPMLTKTSKVNNKKVKIKKKKEIT